MHFTFKILFCGISSIELDMEDCVDNVSEEVDMPSNGATDGEVRIIFLPLNCTILDIN